MAFDAHTPLPDPTDVHVGVRIRSRRKALGVSQEKLAEALGLTFQQIQKYEKGSNRVSASKLFAISVELQVPVGYFFEGIVGSVGTVAVNSDERAAVGLVLTDSTVRAVVLLLAKLDLRARRLILSVVDRFVDASKAAP